MRSIVIALLVLSGLNSEAHSQTVYTGERVQGLVVDSETGVPLSDVHVVERWQWLTWYSSYHESEYVPDRQRTRVLETVTTSDGRFAFPGWGPEIHLSGHPSDFDDPRLMFFKPGYEPLQIFNDAGDYTGWLSDYWAAAGRHNSSGTRRSQWNGQTIRLKRFHGACMDYGRLLERFNFDMASFDGADRYPGLRSNDGSGWLTIPKMMEALELERSGMGRDGAHTMATTLPQKMSFRGRVAGPNHGWVLVSVRWPVKAMDPAVAASGVIRFIDEQGGAPLDGLVVSPWQRHGFDMPEGWQLDRVTPPNVRVYHSEMKFQRTSEISWSPTEQTLAMKRLPETVEAQAAELAAWKRDIEATASDQSVLNRRDFIATGLLVDLFQKNCVALPPALQTGLCFDADSPEVRKLAERDALIAKADAAFRDVGSRRSGTLHGWENYLSDQSFAPGSPTDCVTTPDTPPPRAPNSEPPLRARAPGSCPGGSSHLEVACVTVVKKGSAPAVGGSSSSH